MSDGTSRVLGTARPECSALVAKRDELPGVLTTDGPTAVHPQVIFVAYA
jgi:hypothetical protein